MVGEGSHRGGWKHGKGGERARRFNVHEVPLGEEKQLEHMRGSQKDGQDPRGQLEKETGSEQQLGKHLPSPGNDLEQKMERVMSVVLRPPQPPAPPRYCSHVLAEGGKIASASFVPEGPCTAAKGVGPLLSQIFWARGTGTCLLDTGWAQCLLPSRELSVASQTY